MKFGKFSRVLALMFGMALLRSSPSFAAGTHALASDGSGEGSTVTLVATVRSLDSKAATLDLLTGSGHAVRVVRIWLAPETKVAEAGAVAALAELKPGTIVRVRYWRSENRNLARTVEVEERPAGRP